MAVSAHPAGLVATSRADDLSLRALADIVGLTMDENVRIVGGQMVALLLTAFPVPGVAPRRTRDADTAITIELAGSGALHDRLLERGYSATSGNSYVRAVPDLAISGAPTPELSVDLLVPSLDGRFGHALHGGRGFDAAPGLALALSTEPIELQVRATLLDETTLDFTARVPTVETAVAIKASAYRSRLESRDVEDLYGLLEIADAYPPDQIGGWRLQEVELRPRGATRRCSCTSWPAAHDSSRAQVRHQRAWRP